MALQWQVVQQRHINGRAHKHRLSEQVAQHIRELIVEGGFQPGAKLATESELAERLGVSRTVVREAVKSLEEWRIIRSVTGKGLYVAEMNAQAVSEAFGRLLEQSASPLIHVSEVRRMIEIEIAGLAAERATAEDLAALDQTCERMLKAHADAAGESGSADAFIDLDLEFHEALAIAAHNPLLNVMLEPVAGLLRQLRRVAASVPGALDEGLNSHRQIFEQVKARDPSGARSKMREHLIHAETWVAIAHGRTRPDNKND